MLSLDARLRGHDGTEPLIPEVDILRILFSNTPIEESDEDKPGVILDYDKDGNLVGREILNAAKRMENPKSIL